MTSSYKLHWPILGQPPRVQISIPSRRRITAFKNFILFCRLKTTTENLWDKCTIKEHWKLKKCTNAWVLDSPPTSKFKTLKKVNSMQFESPTCSYTLRPSRVKWRRGYNFFSASNCDEWRGTTSSLQRRKCYKSSTISWLDLHFLSSSKKSDP